MLLILPVSHVDLHLAVKQSEAFIRLGGLENVRALVVVGSRTESTPESRESFEQFLQNLKAAGLVVDVHRPIVTEAGWPISPNAMFVAAFEYLKTVKIQEPAFFMEPDCAPVKFGWYAALKEAYGTARASGKAYLGVLMGTAYRNTQTGVMTVRGQHLMGVAVYPPGFPTGFSRLFNWLATQKDAFDVYLENEVVPRAAHTDLIAHRWGSCNYRYDAAGTLICDSVKEHGMHGPVPGDAVLIHGCKDPSVYAPAPYVPEPVFVNVSPPPAPVQRGRRKQRYVKIEDVAPEVV